jgi:predicted ATPase/class 3 adenylate cyclase/Flp pilus assembly protein TadD
MSELPHGTVTFLFTDIEGSTRLWEQQPEAMRHALARHDALLREIIEAKCGGRVFKTVGDSFYAVFATAQAAAAAALAAQRALVEMEKRGNEETEDHFPISSFPPFPLRIRMALHTGTAEARGGDYFGTALNRVARLLDAGHGGQILLSSTTAELARDLLPEGASLRDLGAHRLKDLRPEQVFQLVHPGLPSDFPRLKSLDDLPTNLPQQLTSFIGRDYEMAEVKRLLSSPAPNARLVTLVGAGGCGKTRLAQQVGADLLSRYSDGVWLVELAALTDPALVVQEAASVLEVREQPGRDLTGTLADYLQSRNLLLILDNCEHVIGACAPLVETLLRACPNLRVLATSREALGIAGETIWRVPSLMQEEAMSLFAERAASAVPTFAVTPRNRSALAQVCARLDGIPLALELAAARVRVLTVEQIARHMDDRFRLLTGGNRTALPRQQTLRALIDWSYDLLDDAERALLRRLSVFAGGWTLEAAEAVCEDFGFSISDFGLENPAATIQNPKSKIQNGDVLDLLTRLVDKSLVMVEEGPAEMRYRLLETVRQYARDRLLEAGEAATARDRHLACFLQLAETAERNLVGPEQAAWLNRLETEHDNMRAVLDWSVEGETRLRLAGALHRFWLVRGHLTEGRARLEGALARGGGVSDAVRAKALNGAGILAWAQGDFAAARSRFDESLLLRRKTNDPRGMAAALNNLGMLSSEQGDFVSARACYEESLGIYRELQDRTRVAMVLANLGGIAMDQGDCAAAGPLFEESLAMHRESGDQGSMAAVLHNLGKVAHRQGDVVTACHKFRESLAIRRELGDPRGMALALVGLGVAAGARGNFTRSVRLFGAAEAAREAVGATLPPSERGDHDLQAAGARAALGEEEYAALWAEGRVMPLEQAVAYAMEPPSA